MRRFAMAIMLVFVVGPLSITHSASKTTTFRSLELVGQSILGYCSVVLSDGDFTYAGFGSAIVVLDTVDPSQPQILGRTYIPNCFDGKIGLWQDRLFVPRDIYGLGVFDVSSPDDPYREDTYFDPGPDGNDYAGGVEIHDGYAFWANGHKGLTILDADPSSPGYLQKVGGFLPDDLDFAMDVHVKEGAAYLCGRSSGVYVIDVQDVTSPFPIARIRPQGLTRFAADMTSSESYGYLANGPYGMWIIDLSTNQVVSTYFPPGADPLSVYYRSIVLSGDVLYVASANRGVDVIDGSDPADPRFIRTLSTVHYSSQLSLGGNFLYVADCLGGLKIYSLSDPEDPQLISTFGEIDAARDVAVLDGFAYVAYGRHGLAIVDAHDPESPSEEILFDINSGETVTRGVFAAIGLLFVADGEEGLKVFQPSDPLAPELLWAFSDPVNAHDVRVDEIEKIAYLADFDHEQGGLWIVDVNGVEESGFAPAFVRHLPSLGYADRVCKSGERVYLTSNLETIGCTGPVTDPNNGLYVVNESTLEVQHSLQSGYERITDVDAKIVEGESYAFVTIAGGLSALPGCLSAPDSEFRILHVTDEEVTRVNGVGIGGSYFGDYLRAVEVAGDSAYLLHPNKGIYEYDISDLCVYGIEDFCELSEKETAYYKLTCNNYAFDIHLFGDYLYDAHGDSGLYIFRTEQDSMNTVSKVSRY